MKYHAILSILAALFIGTIGASILTPTAAAAQDDELNQMHAHFVDFAESRLTSLDTSQTMSKRRMRIVKDGNRYKATYQVYDRESLTCKIRRSRSSAIPYVGVMKFNVKVMQAVADSPAAIKKAVFNAVQIKPNRQLFSFKGGAWQ